MAAKDGTARASRSKAAWFVKPAPERPEWPDDESPDDAFDPLLRAGATAAAMLAAADLSSSSGADAYLAKFNRFGDTPTLAQLRVAKRVMAMLDAAITNGDPRVWRALERGVETMTVAKEYVALEVLQDFVRRRNRLREPARAPLATRAMRAEAMATVALEALGRLDERFKSLSAATFVRALTPVGAPEARRGRGQKSVFYALADLAVESGAFDAVVQRSRKTDEGVRARAVTRISNDYSKKWNQAHKRRLKSGR